MATYSTDFSEYTVDVAPSDWTEHWVVANSDWIIRDQGGSPTELALEHTSSGLERRALSWDAIDSDSERQDSEVLVKFETSSASGFQFYFRIRGSGSAGNETSYNLIVSSDTLFIHKYDNGVSTSIVTKSITLVADTLYWIRFRVNGSSLKGRFWLDSVSEPSAWDLETTDTAITGDGFVGLGNATAAGTRTFEFFSVGTNGDTAPPQFSEAPTDVRDTQSVFLTLTSAESDSRSTQSVFLVLHAVLPPVRVTQAPFLILAEFDADTRTTQSVALVLADTVECLTKWAQTWTITRTDGKIFAFTSLDRNLTYKGIVHKACDSLSSSATEMSTSLGAVGSMEVAGIISDDEIKDEDLFNGLFDGATVEAWVVPWEDAGGEIPFRILAGTLGDIKQGLQFFSAEIITPGALMRQKPLIEVVTPGCRYLLGDSRCKFDLTTLEVTGSVTTILTPNSINAGSKRIFTDSTRTEADRFYEYGDVTWTSGLNIGITIEVKDFSGGRFTLWRPTPNPIQEGDTYTAVPGCDKSGSICKSKFDNFVNFGGFPDVPGQDRLTNTPDAK